MAYKADNPEGYQYTQFCKMVNDFIRDTCGEDVAMTVNRAPGEKAYIDWVGKTPKAVFDQATQKIKEAHIFVTSVGVSNTYEAECIQSNLNDDNALAIDLGIDNLCTCVTSTGSSFIIDGRRLKSINQWYNKQNSYLQSIKDKQHLDVKQTDRQYRLTSKRNRCVSDYLSKAARLIINYCLNNDIGNIVVGHNETFQKDVTLGKLTNQSFVQIPYGRLRDKLEYLCNLYGINCIKQEESYTSKASFFDRDDIPLYNADNPKDYSFSGTRVKRGLYRTRSGKTLNADLFVML